MSQKVDKNVQLHGRSPYGERGLKFPGMQYLLFGAGRSPYGERGLKSHRARLPDHRRQVALLTESVD